jgi:hypothetical protein
MRALESVILYALIVVMAVWSSVSFGYEGTGAVTYRDENQHQRIYYFAGAGGHLLINWCAGDLANPCNSQWAWTDQLRPFRGRQPNLEVARWAEPSVVTFPGADGNQRIYAFTLSAGGDILVNQWDGSKWKWAVIPFAADDPYTPPSSNSPVRASVGPYVKMYRDGNQTPHFLIAVKSGCCGLFYLNSWDGNVLAGSWQVINYSAGGDDSPFSHFDDAPYYPYWSNVDKLNPAIVESHGAFDTYTIGAPLTYAAGELFRCRWYPSNQYYCQFWQKMDKPNPTQLVDDVAAILVHDVNGEELIHVYVLSGGLLYRGVGSFQDWELVWEQVVGRPLPNAYGTKLTALTYQDNGSEYVDVFIAAELWCDPCGPDHLGPDHLTRYRHDVRGHTGTWSNLGTPLTLERLPDTGTGNHFNRKLDAVTYREDVQGTLSRPWSSNLGDSKSAWGSVSSSVRKYYVFLTDYKGILYVCTLEDIAAIGHPQCKWADHGRP